MHDDRTSRVCGQAGAMVIAKLIALAAWDAVGLKARLKAAATKSPYGDWQGTITQAIAINPGEGLRPRNTHNARRCGLGLSGAP